LSTIPSITTPRVSTVTGKAKNSSKRELIDDSRQSCEKACLSEPNAVSKPTWLYSGGLVIVAFPVARCGFPSRPSPLQRQRPAPVCGTGSIYTEISAFSSASY